jgi:hypothetical protein
MMSVPRLSIEQRRALVMLATAGRDGMTQSLLTALGFDASMRAAAARQQPSSGRGVSTPPLRSVWITS